MIWWLVDNANAVYLLLALGAIIALALFFNNGRVKNLAAIGILVIVGALYYLLTMMVVTDRGQLRNAMDDMAYGALKQNPDKIAGVISDNFEYEGRKGKEVAKQVAATARHFGVNGYKIWDFEVEEVSRDKRQAKATFKLRVDARDGQFMGSCRAFFTLENDKWRLKTIQFFQLIGESEQPFHVPLHGP